MTKALSGRFWLLTGNFKNTFVSASYLLALCQVLVPSPALGRVSADDTAKRQMLKCMIFVCVSWKIIESF